MPENVWILETRKTGCIVNIKFSELVHSLVLIRNTPTVTRASIYILSNTCSGNIGICLNHWKSIAKWNLRMSIFPKTIQQARSKSTHNSQQSTNLIDFTMIINCIHYCVANFCSSLNTNSSPSNNKCKIAHAIRPIII